MSSFNDQMIDDGFDDPEDYLGYLEDQALRNQEDQYGDYNDLLSNESHYTQNSWKDNSLAFTMFFKKINGTGVQIDFKHKKIFIFDSNNKIATIIYFSKGIECNFDILDLLETDHKVGKHAYYVFEKGYLDKNWLWRADIVAII